MTKGSDNPLVFLSIAGSDPCGGAGIQADLKVASRLGLYGCSAITAITAQNSKKVTGIWGVLSRQLRTQLEAILSDFRPDAVKVGMLTDAKSVKIIAEFLERYNLQNVVIDPVLSPTLASGKTDEALAEALATLLFPMATLVTPNLPEADEFERISGRTFDSLCAAYLLKGGHGHEGDCVDTLYYRDSDSQAIDDTEFFEKEAPLGHVSSSPFPTVQPHPYAVLDFNETRHAVPLFFEEYRHPKLQTAHTHGTGCVLSSAIACNLAMGFDLTTAVGNGINFLMEALEKSAKVKLSAGDYGPCLI